MELKRTNLNDKITDTIDDFNDNWETIEDGLDLKANKQQEAWITPTLLNGWTGDVQYRKNQFGKIEFKGKMTGTATGQIAFSLPVGYRPTQPVELLCTRSFSSYTTSINTVGSVSITTGSPTAIHYLDNQGFY